MSIDRATRLSIAHWMARITLLVVPSPFAFRTRRLISFTSLAMPGTSAVPPPIVPAMCVPWP